MNIKILTKDEQHFLNSKYQFVLEGDNIYVKVNDYSRTTVHSLKEEKFSITTKIRRLTFHKEAILLWLSTFSKQFTLIDVQNAVNYLKVSYQDVNIDNVKNALHLIDKRNKKDVV